MKKLLVLITVMVAVLGFGSGAFAAWGDPICTSCASKTEVCELGTIPCPGTQQSCEYFDYDYRDGYCDNNDTPSLCKLIFNICNCENPADFVAGQTIGIRMTILVDGVAGERGAYWSAGTTANVAFGAYASAAAACAGSSGTPNSFGAGKLFRYNNGVGVEVSPAALIADPTCTVPLASQATVILTNIDAGYQITPADELNKLSHWWIDVQPIRTDPAVIQAGQKISLKVELLNQESGGICSDCTAVCECTIDLAVVCCDSISIPVPTQFGMYFPYVTDGGAWNTGIVVTNIGSLLPWAEATVAPADMEATLILTDKTGAKFTYVKDDFTTTNWGFDLGALLPEFDGTPAAGPMWLEVQTNYLVDGYCYIENGVFGLGTDARQWSSLLQIYQQYAEAFGLPTDFTGGLSLGNILD
ncbi:MAG: hypothetical protein PHY29_11420 [Syntrophales bacterium]|nr:hypothetical protein [Syntrophales bacterium]